MQTDIQEIYTKTILPLPDREKLQIATLILEDVTGKARGENRKSKKESTGENGETAHALTLIANMAVDVGVTDLAERHDFYAHGKLED